MSFKSFLHYLHDAVDLSYTHCTHIGELGYSAISLRHTSCNNNRFLYLFGFGNHRDEGILRWIYDCAGVDQHKICFIGAINNLIAILAELSDHKLAVWDVVGAAKCFDKNVMSSWCLLDNWFLLELFFLFLICFWFKLSFGFALLFECFLLVDAWLVLVQIEEVVSQILQIVDFETSSHYYFIKERIAATTHIINKQMVAVIR